MCFGDKSERVSGPGARPAQQPYYPQQQSYAVPVNKMSDHSQQYSASQQHHNQQGYAPPSGPPPNNDYAPPSGPPPSQAQYAPPPGAPPPNSNPDYTAPPPGGPPTEKPKPKHDWETAVPDTSLFPPPPPFFSGWDRSPTNNATEQEAQAGEAWLKVNPLANPVSLDSAALEALQNYNIRLMQPWGFRGSLEWRGPGLWNCKTGRDAPDSCIIGYPPLYSTTQHSPLGSGRPITIYYEVLIRDDSRREETSLALGFTALPYPNFRLPGWHRGSMAVHGDDGHKYVNDRGGGKTFTSPFHRGQTLGIGMTFTPVEGRIVVDCFFTRDGRLDTRWDLHEEQDARTHLPVTGLEGFHDISCAIGTFNAVSFDVVFTPAQWKFRPY